MNLNQPLASVIIPTHNRDQLLTLAVKSVLRQNVQNFEVLIVGDGVTLSCRQAIEELLAMDPRVIFLDSPKGPNHGEIYRHEAILAARSDAILYLCDDDLFLPNHITEMLNLLNHYDFVQSLNGWVNPNGDISLYPGILSDPETRQWILRDDIRYNSVSITGTAHSRSCYLAVGQYWETSPANQWPDHHQWRRMFRNQDIQLTTSQRMTSLQFPSGEVSRNTWSEAQRLQEVETWTEIISQQNAQAIVDQRLIDGISRQIGPIFRDTLQSRIEVLQVSEDLNFVTEEFERRLELLSFETNQKIENIRAESVEQAQILNLQMQLNEQNFLQEIETIKRTISWRITAPLRRIRKFFPRKLEAKKEV